MPDPRAFAGPDESSAFEHVHPDAEHRRHEDHHERIPVSEVETQYDNTGVLTVLNLAQNQAARRRIKVHRMLCFIPAGASGLVTLGNVQIPVGPGTTSLSVKPLILQPEDLRVLQSTIAGTLMLTIIGEPITAREMWREVKE